MADISEMIKKVQSKKAKKKFTRGNRPGRQFKTTAEESAVAPQKNTLPSTPKKNKKQIESKAEPSNRAPKKQVRKKQKKNTDTVPTQMKDSSDTVTTQSPHSSDTVVTQIKDSGDTVPTQMKDSGNTVATQSLHSGDTVATQIEDSADTVVTQMKDSGDTVVTQMKDSGDTVATQSPHSNDTVVTQIEDSGDTNERQSLHKDDTKVTQKRDSADTVATKVATQFLHSGDTVNIDFEEAYTKYIRMNGNRKTVTDFLCKTMIDNGTTSIGGFTYNLLAKRLQIKVTSIRNTIKRIENDNLLKVYANGSGPGTTITIVVAENLLKAYSKASISETNLTKFLAESLHSADTSSDTNSSSSSSSFNNKETTTKKAKTELPEEWLEIQIPPAMKKISFGSKQLKQLFNKGEFEAEEVQESLDNMAYDIESGVAEEKNWASPLHVFMHVLMKEGNVYISSGLAKATLDAAREQKELYARYMEARKKEAEDKLSQKFEEYFKKLTNEDLDNLVPPTSFAKSGSVAQKMILREMFAKGEVK